MRPLYKTTVVIWSEYDGTKLELSSLAYQAEDGDAIATTYKSEHVTNPAVDRAWDEDAQAFFSEDPADNCEGQDDSD